jgi:hypothetical protein
LATRGQHVAPPSTLATVSDTNISQALHCGGISAAIAIQASYCRTFAVANNCGCEHFAAGIFQLRTKEAAKSVVSSPYLMAS